MACEDIRTLHCVNFLCSLCLDTCPSCPCVNRRGVVRHRGHPVSWRLRHWKKYKHHLCQPELLKMTKSDKKFPFPDTAGACWLPSLEWLRVAAPKRLISRSLLWIYPCGLGFKVLFRDISISDGTLLWIYRRLIGRSYIALARQDQYIGNISDLLGRLRFWLFWYLLQCCICICNTFISL